MTEKTMTLLTHPTGGRGFQCSNCLRIILGAFPDNLSCPHCGAKLLWKPTVKNDGLLKQRIRQLNQVAPTETFPYHTLPFAYIFEINKILDEAKKDLSVIEKLSITDPILISKLIEIKEKYRKWFGEVEK